MNFYRKINDDLIFLGASDRRTELFENMFVLPWGVNYNSYLLLDSDKTALIDGVDQSVCERHLRDVSNALDGRDLDYFIVQHVEPDHCASINGIMVRYPEAKLVISKMGLKFLGQFYDVDYSERALVVEEGDKLQLGKHELEFVMAPNVHWPEVMVTYDHHDKALFSADAFGSFKALDGHLFADQVNYDRDWLDEARRYYINIVGSKGVFVQRLFAKLDKLGLDIQMVLPLHGLIFRTPEDIQMIMEKYDLWSSYQPEEAGVTLVAGSMYGNTMEVMEALAGLLADKGVEHIKLYDVAQCNRSYIISDLFRYSHAVFACPTYNTNLFPDMEALIRDALGLNFSNRKIALIENRSWGGKALKQAQDLIASGKGLDLVGEPLQLLSAIKQDQLAELEKLADAIVESL